MKKTSHSHPIALYSQKPQPKTAEKLGYCKQILSPLSPNLCFMITITLGIALLASCFLNAQNLAFENSTTRALIVGISQYQDEEIPNLQFAHNDAEAFATFLKSKAGGALAEENIQLLTNEQATTAQIAAGMDWLIEDSQEGDQAIIYFSGHGDVETKTALQLGFLLTYDSPPTTYIAGAFPLFYLQSVITTLSQKNVQVMMVSDACRAGKLAGSEIGGTQATTSNLAKQYANEIKIMSCQANEFSLEAWKLDINYPPSYKEVGDFYSDIGRLQEAEFIFEKALELKPDYIYAMAQLAQLYFQKGDVEKGDEIVQRQLKIAPGHLSYYYYRMHSRYDIVENIVKWTSQQNPGDFWDDWSLAWAYFDTGRRPRAFQLLENVIQTDPNNPLFYLLKAQLYFFDEQFEKSKVLLQQAVELDSNYIHVLNAFDYFQKGDFDAATPAFEKAIEAFPWLNNLKYSYCRQKVVEGKLEEALDLFENPWIKSGTTYHFIQNDPLLEPLRSQERHQQLMRQYYPEKYGVVLTYEELEKGAKYYPDNCSQLAGIYFYDLNENEHAERLYRKAVELDPSNDKAQEDLLRFYMRSHQYEKAASFSQEVLNSENGTLQWWIATTYLYNKNLEKAEEHYQKSNSLKDSSEIHLTDIGAIYLLHHQVKLAEDYFKKAIQLNPKDFFAKELLATLYYALQKEAEAHEILDKMIEAQPRLDRVYYQKAFMYLQSGQEEAAKAVLENSKVIWPENELVLVFLEHKAKKDYKAADGFYEEFMDQFSWWPGRAYFDYLYCEMKIEQGEYGFALDVLEEILKGLIRLPVTNFHLLQNDPDLEPLRNLERYGEMMRKYFPNKY